MVRDGIYPAAKKLVATGQLAAGLFFEVTGFFFGWRDFFLDTLLLTLNCWIGNLVQQLLVKRINSLGGLLHIHAADTEIVHRVPHLCPPSTLYALGASSLARYLMMPNVAAITKRCLNLLQRSAERSVV